MNRIAFTLVAGILCTLINNSEAARYVLPDGDAVLGELQLIPARANDTLVRLGRRYGLGYQEIVQANRATDRWLPTSGAPVILPTQFVLPDGPRRGLLINLAEMRLYYYPRDIRQEVWSFPIGIGRQGWQTPLGTTRIHSKIANPGWTPPASIRREYEEKGITLPSTIPPGPENPLGDHALRLTLPGYLLHGTNRPAGVGMRVSHGCIRLYPEDIAALFEHIPAGTEVRIVDQPAKLGWRGDRLYLEIHPPAYERNRLSSGTRKNQSLIERISTLTEQADIDWRTVTRLLQNANGVPAPIGHRKAPKNSKGESGETPEADSG